MNTRIILLVVTLLCTTVIADAQIKVFNGGVVSIGTTLTPATGCRLQLIGNSVFTENTDTIISAAYIRGLNRYSTASAPDYTWYNNTMTGIFHPATNTISFSTNGNEVIRFAPSGNVMIANPTDYGEKLCVNAGNQSAFNTYVHHTDDYMYAQSSYVNRPLSKALSVIYNSRETFRVYGNGDVWSYGYYNLSDSKFKENIKPITGALDKVLKLNGVSYNFIPDVLNDPNDTITYISPDPPKTIIGLIAEDVEPIVPEVVKTFDEGIMGISYCHLVALLIEAIKEQQAQIDSLKQAIVFYNYNSNPSQSNPGNNNLKYENQGNSNNGLDSQFNSDKPLLFQNVPNPFNQKTNIRYYLPESSIESSILVFDMQGSLIKTFKLINKGMSDLEISAGEFHPGMYMYSLICNGKEIDTKKMILTQ
jgi:hypothetical protein